MRIYGCLMPLLHLKSRITASPSYLLHWTSHLMDIHFFSFGLHRKWLKFLAWDAKNHPIELPRSREVFQTSLCHLTSYTAGKQALSLNSSSFVHAPIRVHPKPHMRPPSSSLPSGNLTYTFWHRSSPLLCTLGHPPMSKLKKMTTPTSIHMFEPPPVAQKSLVS